MLSSIDFDKLKRFSPPSTFTLIKEYPNSPKIGTIAVHIHDNKYSYGAGHITHVIDLDILKSNPEFWQECYDLIFLQPNLHVHKNETVYGVLPKNMWQTSSQPAWHAKSSKSWLWFKTESERDMYKQSNMPVLSINDIEKCFGKEGRIKHDIPLKAIVPAVKQYLKNKQS